jgi:hypothetical protein
LYIKKISGRSPKKLSFGIGSKAEDATLKKTKTRFLYPTTPSSQEVTIDLGLAQTISNQYAPAFAYDSNRLNSVASKLVGKHRTSGALNPKAILYQKRLDDLTAINQRIGFNPEEDEGLLEDAADTMLAGGKIARKKKRTQKKRSKRSKTRSRK